MEKGLLDDKPVARRLHQSLMKVNSSNTFTAIEAGKEFAQQTFLAVVVLEDRLNNLRDDNHDLNIMISQINEEGEDEIKATHS